MSNSDKKELISSLLDWDEKHTEYLKRIYSEHSGHPNFINLVIDLFLNHTGLDHSTSWLIKHHVDMQGNLNTQDITNVLSNLKNLSYWGSTLHILQIIPKVELKKDLAEKIEIEVFKKLKSDNTFVRASAYEAYFEIVKLIPELKNEFRAICVDALEREKASVKVKIKRGLQKL